MISRPDGSVQSSGGIVLALVASTCGVEATTAFRHFYKGSFVILTELFLLLFFSPPDFQMYFSELLELKVILILLHFSVKAS